ncbi:MAG TPA: class I SAM-dependent methyltransferase [Kofleriaceae bacterium]|nr:class I SAM-dependent methyltransferase [Kofleriaceae bacterium]
MPDPIVRLPAEAAQFIAGGGRDVDSAKLAIEAAPGAQLRLEDDRGDELGLAIFDPDNDRLRVMATPADGFPSIGGALLGWRVERAMRLRRDLGLVETDATYRVLHGAGDGVPGFTCDVLGAVGVLYAYSPALLPLARLLADAVRGFAKLTGVCIKIRARGGADQVPQEIVGDVPDTLVAREHGVPFEIHPRGGLNTGLFTDMREHRRGLARFAADRRVLNLFSYTGALSVACARAGARTVTSVDTSPGVAAWAQANFSLSELRDPKRYRFETGDAVRFLARAAKDREQYDLILIDPPTFSTARGAPWTLDKDYPDLIAQASSQLAPGGLLWLAANTHELGSLVRLAARGFKKSGRTAAVLETGGLPPDYPTLPAQLRDRYLQVALFRVA